MHTHDAVPLSRSSRLPTFIMHDASSAKSRSSLHGAFGSGSLTHEVLWWVRFELNMCLWMREPLRKHASVRTLCFLVRTPNHANTRTDRSAGSTLYLMTLLHEPPGIPNVFQKVHGHMHAGKVTSDHLRCVASRLLSSSVRCQVFLSLVLLPLLLPPGPALALIVVEVCVEGESGS